MFLHTERPFWLDESYSDAIAIADTGIVRRNMGSSATSGALFHWLFKGRGKFLDVAGGYGIFTRMMRDMGFDCYWNDPFTQNIFARGFEATDPSQDVYRGVTAFEAIEHVENPLQFIRDIFDDTHCEAFVFSTELYPGPTPPDSWWYYGVSTGQHISFCNLKTLETIARRLDLRLLSHRSIHMLTKRNMSRFMYKILTSKISAKLYPIISTLMSKSRIADDHTALANRRQTSEPG